MELETSCGEDDYALKNILGLDSSNQISSQKKVGASRVKLKMFDVYWTKLHFLFQTFRHFCPTGSQKWKHYQNVKLYITLYEKIQKLPITPWLFYVLTEFVTYYEQDIKGPEYLWIVPSVK